MLDREQHRRNACADADLGVNVLQVVPHRVLTNYQLLSHFTAAQSTGQHAQDVDLTLGETGWLRC